MFKRFILSFALLIGFTAIIFAQITVEPALPTDSEPVTIYLNTEGTGLEGYSGIVYAHTGLTVNGENWQYVIGDWGNNTNQPALEKNGANSYKLEITPSIRDFYNVVGPGVITEMSFVFRSEDGTMQTSPDFFYGVYPNSISVLITKPSFNPVIVQLNDVIQVEWAANMADSSFLYVGDELVFADTGSSFTYDITITDNEKKWVMAVAKSGTESVSDSFYYYVRGDVVEEELPEGIRDGITYTSESSAILCLYAPEKEYVFAWGDYSDWELTDEVYMKRTPDQNRYWIEITGLEPKKQYIFQYFIDNEIRVGDMYCDQVSDPWNDQYISSSTYPNLPPYPVGKTESIASVLQTAQDKYEWKVTDYTPPKNTDLVIYELLVRDFIAKHDYNTLIDTLDYLERLGINAIELMPFNEFEGNLSWGYNPNYYFAPDKYYGPRNTLKAFIDECHSRGISVIMDMVLNHANSTCPFVMMYYDRENGHPAANNPWFNEEGNFPYADANWGSDFNQESPHTQALVDSINSYWMSEYNIDGFRFDFTKGFSNTIHGPDDPWGSKYDPDRITILKRMADEIWKRKADAVVIFEHLSENSEEKVLADYGIMLWGKMTTEYNEGTMGYNENQKSDLYWGYYGHRNWNEPSLVTYMESHDEERLMYKNETYGNSGPDYNVKDIPIGLQRQALAANFFYTIPGPKMIWQFGERGYDISIEYNGRTGEKPAKWDYMLDFDRRNLYYVNQALINLKIEEDVFETDDFSGDGRYAKKWFFLKSQEMDVVVLGNFDVVEGVFSSEIIPVGTWYEFWTGDTLEVTEASPSMILEPGEYRLYSTKKLDTPAFVGIDEKNLSGNIDDAVVFPNPATAEISLLVNMKKADNTSIDIYDLQGKKLKSVFNGKLTMGINDLDANIADIQQGLYLVVIRTANHQLVKKLMVK